jgi:hypothetical protein
MVAARFEPDRPYGWDLQRRRPAPDGPEQGPRGLPTDRWGWCSHSRSIFACGLDTASKGGFVTGAVRPALSALPSGLPKLAYGPSFDGLRGIAVLAVIGTHFNVPSIVNSGLVGVTLFFVLSGYLITRLVLAEHASTGDVNFTSFYRRRLIDPPSTTRLPSPTDPSSRIDPSSPDDRGVIYPAERGRPKGLAVPPTIVRRDIDPA